MNHILAYPWPMASLVVQIVSIGGAFGLGWAKARGGLIGWSVLIGWFANVVGQLFLAGGGPGFFVGFVGLPIWCILAAYVGRGFRECYR